MFSTLEPISIRKFSNPAIKFSLTPCLVQALKALPCTSISSLIIPRASSQSFTLHKHFKPCSTQAFKSLPHTSTQSLAPCNHLNLCPVQIQLSPLTQARDCKHISRVEYLIKPELHDCVIHFLEHIDLTTLDHEELIHQDSLS